MKPYHKILTVYKRDPDTKYKTFLEGQFACPEFEYLKFNDWYFTEKIDGTNIRVMWVGNKVIFGGKSNSAMIPTFLFTKLQKMFPIEKFKIVFPDTDVCLYGEGFGARIQKGGGNYIPNGVSFILFDIRIGDTWLDRTNVNQIANNLKISSVPIIGSGTLCDAVDIVRIGFPSQIGSQIAEGIVMRPRTELLNKIGHRIIAKIKHKDFMEA